MRFVIMVTGPAYGTQQSTSAFQFAQAVIDKNHTLKSIFFYRDGVYNANKFISPASDEFDLVRSWKAISLKYNIKMHICTSAALRRGIINDIESKRLGVSGFNLENIFSFSSLTDLIQAILNCDRMVQF